MEFFKFILQSFWRFAGFISILIISIVGFVAVVDTIMKGIAKMIHGEPQTINHYINTKEIDKKLEEVKQIERGENGKRKK